MYERAEDFPELVELLRVLYKILHSAKVYPKSEALCEIIYYEDYLDEKYGRRKDAVRTAACEEVIQGILAEGYVFCGGGGRAVVLNEVKNPETQLRCGYALRRVAQPAVALFGG